VAWSSWMAITTASGKWSGAASLSSTSPSSSSSSSFGVRRRLGGRRRAPRLRAPASSAGRIPATSWRGGEFAGVTALVVDLRLGEHWRWVAPRGGGGWGRVWRIAVCFHRTARDTPMVLPGRTGGTKGVSG
jgi:hypothetical protein